MLSYTHCTLCPRACGVDRTAGELGFCRMPAQPRAARAALHLWEEPVISGDFGSGAVFFSGCSLQCIFCQNEPISHGGFGKALSSGQLREIFLSLIDQGACNINLVTGTQFLPSILEALVPKLPVPVVWNCSGYESLEMLRALDGLIDVYLPDFKYNDAALAEKLSGAPDYPEVARRAILEMVRQTGPAQYQDGLLIRGTLVRHLLLPGQVENALSILDWIADQFPAKSVPVSLMRQYVPMGKARQMPPFDRAVTQEEYDGVLSWLYLRGLDGFLQEEDAASDAFIPAFDLEGL